MALPRRLINCMHKHGFKSERQKWGIAVLKEAGSRYILHPERYLDICLEDIPRLLALPQDAVDSEWAWREVHGGYHVNLLYAEHVIKPFLMARLEAGV